MKFKNRVLMGKGLHHRNLNGLGSFSFVAILSIASVSWANQTTCRESLKQTTELSVPKTAGLDDLINQLTAGTVEENSGESVILASGHLSNSATNSKGTPLTATSRAEVERDPRSMSLEELLESMGLKPYLVRLAGAEFIKLNEGGRNLELKEEQRALLNAIVANNLSPRQKKHIGKYKTILEEITRHSGAVHRIQVINEANKGNRIEESSIPHTLADLFYSNEIQVKRPSKKPGLFSRLFGSKESRDTSGADAIPYENPEQFAQALKERPVPARLKILEKKAPKMGLLSHLEVYQILMAIPTESQAEVYSLLRPYLIGRIDFYPLEVLKQAADVEGDASLETTPVKPAIILTDLRETGQQFDLFEVYAFLKLLNFNPQGIAIALSGRTLTLEQLQDFMQRRSSLLPLEEVRTFVQLFADSNSDSEIIEKGRQFLKTLYQNETQIAELDQLFDRALELKRSLERGTSETHDAPVQNTSVTGNGEESQLALIQALSRVNWSHGGNSTPLHKAIEGLETLRPASEAVQKKRIEALANALFSDLSDVRQRAANAIAKICELEQDAFTQESLLTLVKVNWSYGGNNDHLIRLIEATEKIIPANEHIEQLRIAFLGAGRISEVSGIRTLTSEALCRIASCLGRENEANKAAQQFKLIDRYSLLDWEKHSKVAEEELMNAIEALRNLQPINNKVQELRIELLSRSLSNPKFAKVRLAAAKAFSHIASSEQDLFTQAAILTQRIEWSPHYYDSEHLLEMVGAIGEIKPANKTIAELRSRLLQDTLFRGTSNLARKVRLVQCLVSECDTTRVHQSE